MKFLSVCVVFALLLSGNALAEESPWEFTGAAGLAYSGGNSDSATYSVQFLGSYITETEEAYLGLDYFYSEDGAVRATDSLKIFSQYNHDISERFYIGAYGGYFRDSVANIEYRIDPSLLLGYRLINKEDVKLAFEAGPGYTWRERGGIKSDFATLRFSEKFEYHFNKTTKFWQSLAFTPRVNDFSDYLLDFDIGIETRLSSQWSLRTFARHRIDSMPSVGTGRSDTSLILGVAYELGGLPEPEESAGRRSLMPDEENAASGDTGWISTAALGFSLNKGNADSSALNLAWNTAYLSDEREFIFDIAQTFRENNGATSEDKTVSRIQYNRFLSERFYLGGTLGYLRDDLADIAYRATPGFIAGYKAIKTDTTKLAFEAGPAYTFESQGGITDSFASIVVAERFSHGFNDRVTLVQSIEANAELADFGNYSALATIGLDTKISDRLLWKITASHTYEAQPAAGRVKNDTALTSSIAIKY